MVKIDDPVDIFTIIRNTTTEVFNYIYYHKLNELRGHPSNFLVGNTPNYNNFNKSNPDYFIKWFDPDINYYVYSEKLQEFILADTTIVNPEITYYIRTLEDKYEKAEL